MRKLHIVHTENSCGWGGQEIRILTESEGMLARGHQVTLLCPKESQIYEAARQRGIPTVAMDIRKKRLGCLWRLYQWLATHRKDIDIVNTHSSTDSWLTAVACKLLSNAPPIVRTRHVSSHINQQKSTFWLYQKAVRHLVVTGEPLRQWLHTHNHFTLESMTSVPTGINLEKFVPGDKKEARARHALDESSTWVGILATLRSWKGHQYLLEAVAMLRAQYPNLKLLVIGDGPQRQNLEAQAAQLQIPVQFTGNQPNPESWLPALDVFVLPSYGDEGVSQAVMQAMACRLPVVTTDVGGMRDAVQHEKTGLFVATKDSQAIADAVARFLNDPLLATQLAQAGYERAQQYFGIETMLDRMQAIFMQYARQDV